METLQALAASLQSDSEQAIQAYEKKLAEAERFVLLSQLALIALIIIVGAYSFAGVVKAEAGQARKMASLKSVVAEQNKANEMDAHILSKVSDFIALADKDGGLMRINPALDDYLDQIGCEQVDSLWALLMALSEEFDSDRLTEVYQGFEDSQNWKSEVRIHDDICGLLDIRLIQSETLVDAKYLMTITNVSDLKAAQEKIEHQANHDAVTSLPNRHYFQNQLKELIKTTKNNKLALMYTDLDNFKQINDTLGYHYGDLLLRAVSARI